MVIDTSALIAILTDEPERAGFNRYIEESAVRLVSAATVLEAALVIESRKGEHGGRELDLFLHRARFEIVPVDEEQVETARAAWRMYRLNYGGCFSYALAKQRGEALLYKGEDFARTDLKVVFPAFRLPEGADPISLPHTLATEDEE